MEKTPLEIAQQAFIDWLQLVDDVLADAMLSFEEFTGHGLRHELHEAGRSLARAEYSLRSARIILAAGMEQGRPESDPEFESEPEQEPEPQPEPERQFDDPPIPGDDDDLPPDTTPQP